MKRFYRIVLMVSAVLCLLCGLLACDERHQHAFVYTVTTQATCAQEGVETGVCSCGETTTRPLPKTEHAYGSWQQTEAAMCTHEGTQQRVCSVCGGVENRSVPKTDHMFGGWQQTVAATCTREGKEERSCTSCGLAESRTIAVVEHTWEEFVVRIAPTCTAAGEMVRTCSVCAQTESQSVPKLEHVSEMVEGRAPTCTEDGLTQSTRCKECKSVLTAAQTVPALGHEWPHFWKQKEEGKHYHACIRCNQEEVKDCALIIDRKDATCTEAGYAGVLCLDCGYEKKTTIPELGHQYEGAAYVEKIEYADAQTVVTGDEASAHTHKHYRECRRGCGAREEEACTFGQVTTVEPTCTVAGYTTKTCTKCGSRHEEETAAPNGHTPEAGFRQEGNILNSQYHFKTCTVCHEVVERKPHDIENVVTPVTCLTDGESYRFCADCGFKGPPEYTRAPGRHVFGEWFYDGDEGAGGEAEHYHQRTCKRCGAVERNACQIVSSETLPTCTAAGETRYACEVCKTSFDSGYVQSLGHLWTEDGRGEGWTRRDDALCVRTCLRCAQTQTKAHDFEETQIDATCTEPAKVHKICNDCRAELTQLSPGKADGHKYLEFSSITEDEHTKQCSVCGEQVVEAHDFSESNLCACGYDGLVYHIEGEHCVVMNDNKVPNSKHVVIPAYHTPLGSAQRYAVTKIHEYAFRAHKTMTSVQLPDTLEVIGEDAFASCLSLQHVSIEGDGEPQLSRVEEMAFYQCFLLESFEAPPSLTYLGPWAFGSCRNLSDIVLGDHVQEIGRYALNETAFASDPAHYTDGVLYIGPYAIRAREERDEAGVVKDLILRNGTTTIAAFAFETCTGVTRVVLPATLKTVDANAFINCTSLARVEFLGDVAAWFGISFENDYSSPLHYAANLHIDGAHDDIHIPEGVTRIPSGTFAGTQITAIDIPSTVTSIGARAFADCALLTQITFGGTDGSQITFVGRDAFTNSAYYLDKEKNWQKGMLVIGKQLIATDPEALDAHVDLTTSGIVTLCENAFKGCVNLQSISLPSTLVRIGAHVIEGCTGLKSVVFNDDHTWLARNDRISRAITSDYLSDGASGLINLRNMDGEWYVYKRANG